MLASYPESVSAIVAVSIGSGVSGSGLCRGFTYLERQRVVQQVRCLIFSVFGGLLNGILAFDLALCVRSNSHEFNLCIAPPSFCLVRLFRVCTVADRSRFGCV